MIKPSQFIVYLIHCQVERGDPNSEAMLFSVPDFIGFACREVGKCQYRVIINYVQCVYEIEVRNLEYLLFDRPLTYNVVF